MAGATMSQPAIAAIAARANVVFAEVFVVIAWCMVVAPEGRSVLAAIRPQAWEVLINYARFCAQVLDWATFSVVRLCCGPEK